jgi:small subunit ribosomal protein S5
MSVQSDKEESSGISEKTVKISRVSKVVKGGRRFSFSALVVTGDRSGKVGFGLGKSLEVPDAIRKATDQSKKEMIKVAQNGGTIPHEVIGKFGPTKVVFKPAAPGTGIIAGAAVRAICEAAGYTDIRTKCIGSNNAHNVLHATLDGLRRLRSADDVSKTRCIKIEEVEYRPY